MYDILCVIDPRRRDLGIRLIGPEESLDYTKPEGGAEIKTYTDPSRYNLFKHLIGIAEGPNEISGKDVLELDMYENNAVNLEIIGKKFPEVPKRLESEKEENVLMSFLILSKNFTNPLDLQNIKTGDIFNIFSEIDDGFNKNLIGNDIRGDDEVNVGKVIAQQFNAGMALINIEKFNSKPFTLMTIGGYESVIWKSQPDNEKDDSKPSPTFTLHKK